MESMRDKGIFLVVTYGIIEQIVQGENIPEFTKSKAKEYIKKYFEVISTAREVGTMLAAGGTGFMGDLTGKCSPWCLQVSPTGCHQDNDKRFSQTLRDRCNCRDDRKGEKG
jgi:hypothetical protein